MRRRMKTEISSVVQLLLISQVLLDYEIKITPCFLQPMGRVSVQVLGS